MIWLSSFVLIGHPFALRFNILRPLTNFRSLHSVPQGSTLPLGDRTLSILGFKARYAVLTQLIIDIIAVHLTGLDRAFIYLFIGTCYIRI